MSDTTYVQLLGLMAGVFLLAGVLMLWRRELASIVRLLAAQGAALAALVAVLGVDQGHLELLGAALGVLVLRVGLLPYLMRRVLAASGEAREAQPLVNVSASLLAAAVLTLLAYAVSRPLVALAPSPATQAIPVGLTVVLVGLFMMATRRRALSQIVGLLLVDNGITAIAFLATAGVPLTVELGVSLDVLLAVVVLLMFTTRMRTAFGATDLDELRELHD